MNLPPALAGLLVQAVATVGTLVLYGLAGIAALEAPWICWAFVQAALAVLLATAIGQAPWWIAIHSLFVPAALLLDRFSAPTWLYLAGAALLALTNGNAMRERVPLFLTSRAARERLLALLPEDRPIRFVDVGCGFGGVVSSVGRERPTLECLGLETAWLPYLVSRLRCWLSPNQAAVARRDLWTHDLSGADVVYAYLSPVPMERLWCKVLSEMRPGTLLISNSFPVPGVEPLASHGVEDATGSVLHVYRLVGAGGPPALDEATAAPIAVASAACS